MEAAAPPPPAPPPALSGLRLPRWAGTAALVAVAAVASATVAYLVARDDGTSTALSTTTPGTGTTTTVAEAPASLAALVPRQLWKDCAVENQAAPGAVESAVCLQPNVIGTQNPPDRWQISIYPDAAALHTAYANARALAAVTKSGGRCDGTFWGGSGPWVHEGNPPKPGGDRFCYFDGNDAVIVWTHERLGQPNHRDMLAIAREGGTDHAALYNWWRFWHHRMGKVGS